MHEKCDDSCGKFAAETKVDGSVLQIFSQNRTSLCLTLSVCVCVCLYLCMCIFTRSFVFSVVLNEDMLPKYWVLLVSFIITIYCSYYLLVLIIPTPTPYPSPPNFFLLFSFFFFLLVKLYNIPLSLLKKNMIYFVFST